MDYKATIGGKPVQAQSHFSVLNPATGAEAGRAPDLGLADLNAAVAAASEAFVSWSAQSDAALQAACAAVTAKIERTPGGTRATLDAGTRQAPQRSRLPVGNRRRSGLGGLHGRPFSPGESPAGQ